MDLVLSLVLDAELHSVGGHQVLGYRDGEGEGVRVGAAVDVVQVLAPDVLEGAPGVKRDSDRDRLLKADVPDLDGTREEVVLYGTRLQTNLLCFKPDSQVQIVCSWWGKVQNQARTRFRCV